MMGAVTGSPPIKVVFVAGAGRSGSTLLDLLLGSAPGACAVSELRHIWRLGFVEDEFCGCGEPFSRCPFWQAVVESAGLAASQAHGREVDRSQEWLLQSRHAPALTWSALLRGRGRRERERWEATQLQLLRAIQAVSGARTIVDSSKNPMYGLLLATLPEVDLRVVHLVRDSRAVAYSWARREKPDPMRQGKMQFALAKPWQAGAWWAIANLATELAPPLRRRYLRVRYEELARDPEGWLRRISRFAGLDPVAAAERVHLGLHHSIGGNPMRYEQGEVRVKPDTAWRRLLPAGDRRLVTAITWPLLLRYGYPLRTRQ
jgi:Sulfotransferase family